MKPKTKQEAQRLINELQSVIDELPDEGRGVSEGWSVSTGEFMRRSMYDRFTDFCIAEVRSNGLRICTDATDALDGIAHDSKGRIKVVGYVNAEELKEEFYHMGAIPNGAITNLIDELTG